MGPLRKHAPNIKPQKLEALNLKHSSLFGLLKVSGV